MNSNSFKQVSKSEFNTHLRDLRDTNTKPLIAHVVANGVIGDSRVIKSAATSRKAGLNPVIIGLGSNFMVGELQGTKVFIGKRGSRMVRASRYLKTPTTTVNAANELKNWLDARHEIAMLKHDLSQKSPVKAGKHGRNLLLNKIRSRSKSKSQITDSSLAWYHQIDLASQANWIITPILGKIAPHIIHAHDIIPLHIAGQYASAKRLKGNTVPFVYDAHEYLAGLAEAEPDYWTPYLELERAYAPLAQEVITVSETMATRLRDDHKLKKKPLVVANGPSLNLEPAPDIRYVLGLAPNDKLLVYSGWIDQKRGIETVVKALTKLPQTHLALIVGNTSQTSGITELARNLNVLNRVHLAGYVRPNQIPNYIRSADLGLLPLKQYPGYEVSLPTKFREYILADLPQVVSDFGELTQVKHLGIGETFNPEDSTDLANAIRIVLNSPNHYRSNITDQLKSEVSWEAQEVNLTQTYLSLLSKADHRYTPPTEVPSSRLNSKEQSSDSSADLNSQTEQLKRFGTSLTIAPHNHAGQGAAWSVAVNLKFGIPSNTMAYATKYGFPIDVVLKRSGGIPTDLAMRMRQIRTNTSHLLVDSFATIFGNVFNDDVWQEAAYFDSIGLNVGYIAHGSESRSPSQHKELFEWSYFNHAPDDWNKIFEAITEKNLSFAHSTSSPVFVTTPDLLLFMPNATWLPLGINVSKWKKEESSPLREKPVVLHLPSRADPPIKGTQFVDPVMTELHVQGRIEYVRPENCTHAEMVEHIRSADIVVDQIMTGSYGVTAVEAMAADCLVIGNVGEKTRALMPEGPPIVDATPAELLDAVTRILDDRDWANSLKSSGLEFVEQWHNGNKSAEVIGKFLFPATD